MPAQVFQLLYWTTQYFFSAGQGINYNYPGIIDIYDIGEDVWDTYQAQSPGRLILDAVSANGMVFFAGGNNNDPYNPWSFFSDIDVFTKETGEWTIDYLSEGRQQMGTVASGNKVFFAGGVGLGIYYDVIDIYDTETKTWLTKEYLTIPKSLMGTVAACGKVFFAGGATGFPDVTNVVDIYDMETGEWTVEYLSVARAYIAAVAYEGLVYFAGGTYANNTGSDVIDIYNCEDGTWEDTETLSEPRIVSAHNVYNALVFTGMFDSFNLENYGAYGANGTVDVYYPETDQWDYTVPDLFPARYFYASASCDNRVYYAGGSLGGGAKTDIINILEYDYLPGFSKDKFQELAIRIFPNPFTTTLRIDYNLQHSGKVNLAIYNSIGEQVEVLLNEYTQQGDQEIIFDTEKLSPGIYFCTLKTRDGIQTTKMIKL